MESIEIHLAISSQPVQPTSCWRVHQSPVKPNNSKFSTIIRSHCIPTPCSYSSLLSETSQLFSSYSILNISYKDTDGDFIIIKSDSDLSVALAQQSILPQFFALGTAQSLPLAPLTIPDLTAPDVIKETYLVPCFKDHSISKGICNKCKGKNLIDLYQEPKLKTIHSIIRTEIQTYLPLILKAQQEQNSSAIHSNISCNNCGVFPLRGNRFKCSVCNNFDFCQICERNTSHPHPFIKIRDPSMAPKVIICALDERQRKCFKSKNPQCKPETRLLCRFVKDIEGSEGDIHAPGAVFVKTWRLRNDGQTQWPSGCRIVCTNGDFGGDSVTLPCLKPGEERDVSVTCRCPDKDGQYYSNWRSVDPMGNRFGHKLCIMIIVSRQEERANEDVRALVEIFKNPELVKLAYEKAGGSAQKAAEILVSGNL